MDKSVHGSTNFLCVPSSHSRTSPRTESVPNSPKQQLHQMQHHPSPRLNLQVHHPHPRCNSSSGVIGGTSVSSGGKGSGNGACLGRDRSLKGRFYRGGFVASSEHLTDPGVTKQASLPDRMLPPSAADRRAAATAAASAGAVTASRTSSPGLKPRAGSQKHSKLPFIRHFKRFNSSKNVEDWSSETFRSNSLLQDANRLYEAVEYNDVAAAKAILARRPLLKNCINDLQLSPLDMALIRGHQSMALLLLSQDAVSNPRLLHSMERHLVETVHRLAEELVSASAKLLSRSSSSSSQDAEEELESLEHSHRLAQQLLADFRLTPPAPMPACVSLEVSGPESLKVTVTPQPAWAVVRYRIEWAHTEAFCQPLGRREVEGRLPRAAYQIHRLSPGQPVFVRVAAFNLIGWSAPKPSLPACLAPSAWWQVSGASSSCPRPASPTGAEVAELRDSTADELTGWLFGGVEDIDPNTTTASAVFNASAIGAMSQGSDHTGPSSAAMRSPLRKRSSLHKLFSSGNKFVRRPKQGLYLSVLMHTGEKLLLNEDSLPHTPVESDSLKPATLQSEIGWLNRLIADGAALRPLALRLERLAAPPGSQQVLRLALIQAARRLQEALGTCQLGQVYPRILGEDVGSAVATSARFIVLVCRLASTRRADPPAAFRWLSLTSLGRAATEDPVLAGHLDEIITFSTRSLVAMDTGLYLGYLKLYSSLDSVSILVDSGQPNCVPCIRLRTNSHVSEQEWRQIASSEADFSGTGASGSFRRLLRAGLDRLCCEQLQLSTDRRELRSRLRLYTGQVVQLAPRVSLLLVFPLPEQVCEPPGGLAGSPVLPPGCSRLPLSHFEHLSLSTYASRWYPDLASLGAQLDLLIAMAMHAQRQAFTDAELAAAKARLGRLQSLQSRQEAACRAHRWPAVVIGAARDRTGQSSCVRLCERPSSPASPMLSPSSPNALGAVRGASAGCSAATLSVFFPTHSQFQNHHHQQQQQQQQQHQSTPCSCASTIRVHADYVPELASAVVTLHVTNQITAREVCHRVVGHVNKLALSADLSGSPYYPPSEFDHFCLVACLGDLDRPLGHDFQPLLMLQPPWTDSRLCVRHKSDLSPGWSANDADSGVIDL